MNITIPDFSTENISLIKFNMIEFRILLLISLSLTGLREYEIANEIMLINLKQLQGSGEMSILNIQLIIKLLFNISYNYYNMQDQINSIKYADNGIKFCKEHSSMYCLYLLFYRRGIAKYKIGNKGYRNDLKSCYVLLSILGKNNTIKKFKEITKEKHGIE